MESREGFFTCVGDETIVREKEFKLRKDNHEELLDYLYDI